LKSQGDLNEIEKKLGAREPLTQEKNYKKARIVWKGEILWALPHQIQEASGNLDYLAKILPKSEKVKLRTSFRNGKGARKSPAPQSRN